MISFLLRATLARVCSRREGDDVALLRRHRAVTTATSAIYRQFLKQSFRTVVAQRSARRSFVSISRTLENVSIGSVPAIVR